MNGFISSANDRFICAKFDNFDAFGQIQYVERKNNVLDINVRPFNIKADVNIYLHNEIQVIYTNVTQGTYKLTKQGMTSRALVTVNLVMYTVDSCEIRDM